MPKVITSLIPALAVGIPAIFALVILVWEKKSEKLISQLALSATVVTFVLVSLMVFPSLRGIIFQIFVVYMAPQIWMHFRVDSLGLVFGLTSAAIWFLATLYSLGYMKGEHARRRFYSFWLFCLAWTMGIAFAGNLFTFFIFYEFLSLSTYPLIVQEGTSAAVSAGKKYLIYILVGSSFILFGILFTFSLANSLILWKPGILSPKIDYRPLALLFTTFIIGFGVKGALVPFHGWVLDAHPEAPAPASALLSGVMVNAGAFGIMRVIYNVFGTSLVRELGFGIILAYAASLTIIVASIMALAQDNLKRRLAYSTVGQISYIILGTALLNPITAWGGIVHIANHAFMKSTLFLCSGIILKKAGKRNISELAGIGYRLPITMTVFAVAAFGMIGTPPLAGFTSKWLLGWGALAANKPIFLLVLLASGLLGAAYFLPIISTAFFEKPRLNPSSEESLALASGIRTQSEVISAGWELKHVPLTMLIPPIIGAICTIILGLFVLTPGLAFSLAKVAVKSFFK